MIATSWLRPLLQRPVRALGTVLGVAVGVGSVVATGLASRAAVASMTRDVEALAGDVLEVTRPGGVPLALLEPLRAVAGDVEIQPVVEGMALRPTGENGGDLLRLLGLDLVSGLEGVDGLDVGGASESAALTRLWRGEGFLATRATADRLGLAIGEPLELVVRSRRLTLTLLGLFEPPRVASAWERVLVVDVALAQELFASPERVDRLTLRPRHPLDRDALAARVTTLLPAGTRVALATARRAEGEQLTRSLAFNLTALAGVSILVGMVLVATTLATSIVQRRATLALLRSLGASRGQLGLAVVLEALVIGLVGGLVGVALGALTAQGLVASIHGSVATLAEDAVAGAVHLEPSWLLAGVLLGTLTALGAAVLPLREAWLTPPLQGLREHGESAAPLRWRLSLLWLAGLGLTAVALTRLPPWGDRPVWALLAALCLLSTQLVLAGPLILVLVRLPLHGLGRLATPLRLAQAALASSRQRAAWAAAAVGVAVALAVSMHAMVGSFRRNVVDWTTHTMGSDLYLRPLASSAGTSTGRIAPEVVTQVEALFGSDSTDAYRQTTASVDGAPIALGGAAFAVLARVGGVPFLDGRPSREVFAEALREGAAVVNEPFARRFGRGRGDRITLTTSSGTVERTIAGVYQDFSGHTGRVVVDLADYLVFEPDEGPESIAVYLPEGSDVELARMRLAGTLADRWSLELLDNREIRAEVLAVFDRTFAITVALQTIASAVAALAVVLVLGALVRERLRELAVVRVLGGSRPQLVLQVVGQALFLGLAGGLGGLGVGLVVGWVLVAVVNVQSFGWTLRFVPPVSVAWTALAVLPACVLAGLIPAWLSWRAHPQEVLRESD
jgi:putative ABC transport system permease protein